PVKFTRNFLSKSWCRLRGFLDRVRVFLPICWPRAIALIASVTRGPIDTDDGDAYWSTTLTLEMLDLIAEIRHDAINLLDHCFRKNLDFNSDFNSGDPTTCDFKTRESKRVFSGNEFTRRAVTAASLHTVPHVLNVYDSLMVFDAGDEFGRLVEIVKIFVKLNSDGVADRRVSVFVPSSFKDVLKSFK